MAQRGINKVILVGNLGQDPEVRTTPTGTIIANLNLATGEAWKDQQGQLQERTEWHRVVLYKRLAEVARDYLRKGSKIYVEGRLHTNKWQDKNGQDRYTTEIVCQELQMLDRAQGDNGQREPPSRAPAPRPAPSNNQPPAYDGPDFDDDIPF